MRIEFTIVGIPRSRPRTKVRRIGKFARTYQPDADASWLASIEAAADPFRPSLPLTGPLLVSLGFVFPRPRGHFGTGRNAGRLKANAPTWAPTNKDRDNLDKAVLDCLTGMGFWRSDNQVCAGSITKRYGDRPGALVTIEAL